jgi:hypothetical protein
MARDPVVVRTVAPATGLRGLHVLRGAQDTGGHEGVPTGLMVGGVDLVDGGDGAAAFGELHTSASLHFINNK